MRSNSALNEWVENDFARLKETVEIRYEEKPNLAQTQKRLIEHVRTRYRKNDLSNLLPVGALESLALPGESYKLAFTRGLLTQVYGNRVTDSMLADDGGYVHSEPDDNWWIPSGRSFYSPAPADTPAQELAFAQRHFFLQHRSRDPFGNSGLVSYDAYDLLVKQTVDPLGNRVSADHDYRLLQPFRVTDPNGNRTEVAFDTLGLVAGTAVMGKATETKGDSLVGFVPDLTLQQRQKFLADPLGNAAPLLGRATTRIVYDLDRYRRAQQPAFAATLARETHASDPLPPGGLKVQVSPELFRRLRARDSEKDPGRAGSVVDGGPTIAPRWVGSGWTIFNNKGKPVKQYEPFFDDTHAFRFANQVGVSSMLFYDPVERVVATLHPNHTWEKVVFDPWRQETWDVNDTVLIADPKNDPDVGEFFRRLPTPTTCPPGMRSGRDGALGASRTGCRGKDRGPCGDAHGRPRRLARPNLPHASRTTGSSATARSSRRNTPHALILDIEGNQREVIDAKDRVVMRYDYDMLGDRIHQASMEAGERWMLNDVTGKPLRAWDSRDHQFRTDVRSTAPACRNLSSRRRRIGASHRAHGLRRKPAQS